MHWHDVNWVALIIGAAIGSFLMDVWMSRRKKKP